MFSFLAPFSPAVWISFIGLTILTGLAFQCLEASKNTDDYPDGPSRLWNGPISILKSVGHVTGAAGFRPKTWAGKILVTSWTWSVLLILSAYTANLASFLVIKAEQSAGFASAKQAVLLGEDFRAEPDWGRRGLVLLPISKLPKCNFRDRTLEVLRAVRGQG